MKLWQLIWDLWDKTKKLRFLLKVNCWKM